MIFDSARGYCFIVLALMLSACLDKKLTKGEKIQSALDTTVNMPDSVVQYLDNAVDTMETFSINKKKINWKSFRAQVLKDSRGATTYSQTYPAIQNALLSLGDQHSFFKTPEQHQLWKDAALRIPVKQKKERKRSLGMMRDENIAELDVETFTSGDEKEMLNYAGRLQESIKDLDKYHPKGWIVDLDYNRGGNMWPMLAGIGPLLGEGISGYFVPTDGKRIAWKYQNGEVWSGNELMLKISKPYQIKRNDSPVALFVTHRTASSGEAVVVAFIGRPNTRIYGDPTAGLSSANQGYTLVDGAQLILTSAVFADRNGRLYGSKIQPDVDLSKRWYYFSGFEHEIMLGEVEEWVLSLRK
jgi:hypothetical protein